MASAEEIESWLIRQIASLLGITCDSLDGDTSFDELGIDSITRAALLRGTGRRLTSPLTSRRWTPIRRSARSRQVEAPAK